jgi:DNA invertase Pin-like site-specific DNA recombinase
MPKQDWSAHRARAQALFRRKRKLDRNADAGGYAGSVLVLGAFFGGALLAIVVGAPVWLGAAYAAAGVLVAAALRMRSTGSRSLRRRGPDVGPRFNGAGGLTLAPRPPRLRPPAAPRGTAAAANSGPLDGPGSASPAADETSAGPQSAPPDPQPSAVASCALGYVLIGRTPGDGDDDPGEAIQALCAQRGLSLRRTVRDVEPARGDTQLRPGLRWVLDQLAAGEVQTLVVARLEHLTDSAAGLPDLLRWFEDRGCTLIAIDVSLDTSTEGGRVAAEALAQVGGWERERISVRTRRGLEAARSRGATRGRPAVADLPELRERIVEMRAAGMTLQAIADTLNEEGVPTLRGGAMWRPSSVQSATGYRRPSANSLPQADRLSGSVD